MSLTTQQIIDRALLAERTRIATLMRHELLCFDYLEKGWCEHHGGKCQDIQQFMDKLGKPA